MKRILTIGTIVGMYLVLGCTKQNATVGTSTTPSTSNVGFNGHTVARMAGPGYSQSIPLDEANRMIQSYLTSVNYPSVDNSLRALTFDADTLRKYLSDPKIVTIKFVLAHQPAYINSGNFGKPANMNPQAMTMVIVGLNDNNGYVLNQDNGVYEHMNPCPTYCGNEDAYIH
jgi:hypothetical protein